MLVTPAMSAVDVGRFFGDGPRAFSLEPAYAYHNDNGKGWWYYALWVDDYRDIVVGDVAAIPAAFPPGSVHVSLLTAWMPDEATAMEFVDTHRRMLVTPAEPPRRMPATPFQIPQL